MMATLQLNTRPIRFALVGCGRISANHIEALRQHAGRAELVAVCDNQPQALAQAVARTGAAGFASLEELLARGNVDVVALATPSGLHPRQAMRAARAGCHVLTEKPMATKWDEGMEMVRVCREAGVKLFVVKQNRLNSTMQLLKAAVDAGRFGRIHLATVNVFWTRPQSYYDDAPWRGRWDMDGGAFLNQASHYVDMVDWLVGPVDSVHAYTATLARDIEAEDTGVMSLRLRRGGLASINVTMLTHGKNFEGSITILGERGTVRVGGVAVNRIDHWEFEDSRPEDEAARNANYQTASVYGFGHPLYYANVIDTLRGEAQAQVDGYEGLRSLEVVIAAYRSARWSSSDGCRDPPQRHRRRRRAAGRRHARVALRARQRRGAHRCELRAGAGRVRGQRRRHRQQRAHPEQRVGVRRGDAGGRRVLRPQHGVHQRLQPALGGAAQERVPAHAGQARRHAGRQLHPRLRQHHR
jgi:UDP-N-acetyl-2-amino-2-deoxyglucuronate dehydrogenase